MKRGTARLVDVEILRDDATTRAYEEQIARLRRERDEAVEHVRDVLGCHARGAAGWHGMDQRGFSSVLTGCAKFIAGLDEGEDRS